MTAGIIITVHYGSWETTRQFINAIEMHLSEKIKLIVVNNTSSELPVNNYHANIRILNAPGNLGYFGGASHAFNFFDAKNTRFVIICNNDIEITDKDFFNIMDDKLSHYDVIGPSITTGDGIEQNPNIDMGISFFRKVFYSLYFSNYLIARVLYKAVGLKKLISSRFFSDKVKKPNTERLIYSPHGSFIIFNKSFFQKGGVIDEKLFLYGEEESVSAQAKNLNLRIGFVPSLKILHNEHSTTKGGLNKFKYTNQRKAHNYIKLKYPDYFG